MKSIETQIEIETQKVVQMNQKESESQDNQSKKEFAIIEKKSTRKQLLTLKKKMIRLQGRC